MEKIIILGMGGHAESLVDVLERQQAYEIAGYVVNDRESVKEGGYPVLGNDGDLGRIFQSGITNAAVGVGYLGKSNVREKLWMALKQIGFRLPVVCDPTAILSKSAKIGEGSFIGKGAILNVNASVGKMCIVNTGAILEHDCQVGDFSHISVGTVLCGEVTVGSSVFVGANATVVQCLSIGDGSVVGAGTTIRKNVKANCITWSGDKVKQL